MVLKSLKNSSERHSREGGKLRKNQAVSALTNNTERRSIIGRFFCFKSTLSTNLIYG